MPNFSFEDASAPAQGDTSTAGAAPTGPAGGGAFGYDDAVAPPAPRGPIGYIAQQAKAGLTSDLPTIAGKALQYAGADTVGTAIRKFGEDNAAANLPDDTRGPVTRMVANAVRGAAPIVPLALANLTPAGPAVDLAAVPALAAGFGGAQAQDTYEKAKAAGLSEDEAISAARKTGLISGVGMGAVGAITGGAAAPVVRGLAGDAAGFVRPFLAEQAGHLAGNVASMAASNAGVAKVEQDAGLGGPTPGEAALEGVESGAGLTAALAPFGAMHALLRARAAQPGAGPITRAAGLLPAPVVHVDADGRAKMDGVASGGFDRAQQEGVVGRAPVDTGPEPLAITDQSGNPDPLVSFPDGTVARRSEVENFIASLPPDQQIPARARLLGVGEQPAGPITQAATLALPSPSITVDAQGRALTPAERQAQRDAQMQAASARGGVLETGDIGAGRNSEQVPQPEPGMPPMLPAPAITVGPNGTALTPEQRQAQRDAAQQEMDDRAGLRETGAIGLGRNSEDVTAQPASDQPPGPFSPGDIAVDQHFDDVHQAATSPLSGREQPTPAQIDAGNYPKGHVKIGGLDITVENPQGSARTGTDADGKPWQTLMQAHYGYIRRSEGADGDHVDVFVKPGTPHDFAGDVYVVNQVDPKTGAFDEHKAILGASSEQDARSTYLANYSDGWQGIGSVAKLPMGDFKKWVRSDDAKKPLGEITHAAKPEPEAAAAAAPDRVPAAPAAGNEAQSAGSGAAVPTGDAAARGPGAVAPDTTRAKGLRVGNTPADAEPITVREGIVHVGKYPAVDYDSGEPVKVPANATAPQIAKALRDAGALSKKQRVFGLKEAGGQYALGEPAPKPQTARSAAYDRNPFLAFLATHGLFHVKGDPKSQKTEFSPDKQISVPGYHVALFRRDGKMPDALVQPAIEDGFLPKGATEAQLEDLIHRAVRGERVAPVYGEGQAEQEMQRRMQEHAELHAHETEAELPDHLAADLEHNADDVPWLDSPSNTDVAGAMRALGFTEEEIRNAAQHAEGSEGTPAAGERGHGNVEGAQGEGQGNPRGREGAPAEASAEGLKQQDLLGEVPNVSQQEAERLKAQAEESQRRQQQAAPESSEFTLSGSDRPADVGAARGQKDLLPLDHGELSIPNRTSGIDAELDRYKAEQAKIAKGEAKRNAIARKADKEQAKALFTDLWPAMKEKMGAKFGEKELRDTLDSMVKWEPKKFLDLAEKFRKEQGDEGTPQYAMDETAPEHGTTGAVATSKDVAGTDQARSAGDKTKSQPTEEQSRAYAEAVAAGRKREALRVLHSALDLREVDATIDREGAHTPSGPEDGSPLYDVARGGTYPEDVYSAKGLSYYGTGEDAMDAEAYGLIRRFDGHPNMTVTVYRAVHKSEPSKINPGDWVTIVRGYAVDHGKSALNGDFKIVRQTVHARDIFTSGDSWLEWGYHPQEFKPEFPKGEGKNRTLAERIASRSARSETSAPESSGAFAAEVPRERRAEDDVMPSGLRMSEVRDRINAMRGRMSVDQAQAEVDRITKDWKGGIDVKVVASPKDLPIDDPHPSARGLYQAGVGYVVAGKHSSAQEIGKTLAHEVIAHFGLRNSLGEGDWRRLMKQVQAAADAGNPEIAAARDYVRQAYRDGEGNYLLKEGGTLEADEVAARLIEQSVDANGNMTPKLQWLKWVWAKVANFLRGVGLNVPMTMSELHGVYVDARRDIERGREMLPQLQPAMAARDRAQYALDPKEALERAGAAIERVKGVQAVREVGTAWDGIVRATAPQFRSPEALEAARQIINGMGTNEVRGIRFRAELEKAIVQDDRAQTVAQKARDLLEKGLTVAADKVFLRQSPEDNRAFMQAMDTGDADYFAKHPNLKPIADVIADMFNEKAMMVQALDTGALRTVRENYFPHIWNREPSGDAQQEIFSQLAKRPLEGQKSFTKERIFEDVQAGLKAGFEPVSNNPLDLVMLKMQEMDKYLLAHKTLQALEGSQGVHLLGAGEKAPQGYTDINGRFGNIERDGQKLRYVGRDDVAQVINNYLSPSLYHNKYVGSAFTGYMKAANLLNQFQLGVFSAFHAGFTSMEAVISHASLGIKALSAGDIKGAGKYLASAPAAWIENPRLGSKIIDALVNGTDKPEMARIVEGLELAGAKWQMDERFRTGATKDMLQAWSEGKKLQAGINAIGAITEQSARPILEWLVPRQKFGVFGEMYSKWMQDHPDASHEDLRNQAQQIWNRVDSRLGQVVYDRLFVHNVAKNFAQMLVRAPGWTGGTILEIGGGIKDLAGYARDVAMGKKPESISDRAAYTLSMLMVTAVANATLTAMFTGQQPQNWKDLVAFRTGNLDEYGRPERFMLPTYMKDVYAYSQGPGTTLVNKTHPLMSLVGDVVRNRDYMGTEIRSEDSNLLTQMAQTAGFAAKAFVPFWVKGVQTQNERQGSLMAKAAPLIGVMPSPTDLNKTPAEKLVSKYGADRLPQGSRTQEESDRAGLRRQMYVALRKGDREQAMELFRQGRQQGLLAPNDLIHVSREARNSPLLNGFQHLTFEQAQRVMAVASPEEQAQLQPLYLRKRLVDMQRKMGMAQSTP